MVLLFFSAVFWNGRLFQSLMFADPAVVQEYRSLIDQIGRMIRSIIKGFLLLYRMPRRPLYVNGLVRSTTISDLVTKDSPSQTVGVACWGI